jgi:allophanate hydrolase subunit 1
MHAAPAGEPVVSAFGDSAVRIAIPAPLGLETSARVHAIAARISSAVAGPLPIDSWPSPHPPVEIPTRYGGPNGPDLVVVAELSGLPPAAVVEAHASLTYRALFLGFSPGFAYLGVLPRAIVVPRRAEPRVRVPAGSVALAGEQTAVYPLESPGGWQLIGRTSVALWDPRRDPPARIQPGDAVRFVPER